jgi:hypothetical protein
MMTLTNVKINIIFVEISGGEHPWMRVISANIKLVHPALFELRACLPKAYGVRR